MGRDRQTATINFEISTVWETKPMTTPQKKFRLVTGPEQVTRPKTMQDIWHSVDRASWYICRIRTNKMHFSFLIYFNNISSKCFKFHSDRVSSYSAQMHGKYHMLHIQ
jgi:hypothetical protein